MYTLQFENGSMTIPKAKLSLCGEYFENAFDSKMGENTNKVFPFVNMSREAFEEILHAIKMEEYDFSKSSEEFKATAEYFQFYVEFEFPEGIFGKEVLEKHLGNVGEVPHPPKELIEAMEAPCPFSKDANLKTKDTHIITWVPQKVGNDKLSPNRLVALINSDKSGANKIGFDPEYTYFPEGVANWCKENGKFGSGTGWHMIVGGLASSGLRVSTYSSGAFYNVSVCPVRKFLGP